ncbi:hypothetical protein SKAU_G00381860 [Synaphobranchus kaupii]|uniref:Uncharacterized protein n=1 Tax=Synaphobranchus kaupii TaxID=118154 RepID=A0A9Q1EDS2_SYNKA|nr:hypothetical protein SKAU_G00381860 [Synaphobranchus kaupii]
MECAAVITAPPGPPGPEPISDPRTPLLTPDAGTPTELRVLTNSPQERSQLGSAQSSALWPQTYAARHRAG